MTLVQVTEIRHFLTPHGRPELFIGCAVYPHPAGAPAPRARVMWHDEHGNSTLEARERCYLGELLLLAPRTRATGELQAWEVAAADVRTKYQHARLQPTPHGFVIVVPDDPANPLTSGGTCLCHPTQSFADAWINSAVNTSMGAHT